MIEQSRVNLLNPEIRIGRTFTANVIRWSWILYGVCAIIQFVFFPGVTNIIMIATIGVAWAIMTKVFLRQEMLQHFPFSSFLVFGFTSTQFYFPLLFTTAEGKALIHNLEVPELVFLHSFAGLLVLIIAHTVYRFLRRLTSQGRSTSLFERVGFFTPPKDAQLWLMGLIGMAATYYVYFAAPEVGYGVTGAAGDKFIQGFIPFSYAPFFIPFGKLYGRTEKTSKLQIQLLLGYTFLLFLISIGRNSTGAFMFGFTSVAFSYFLGLLLGVFETRIFTIKNIAIAIFGIWLLVGPLADLRTAMVLVRGDRLTISAEELIALTVDAYFDKEAIKAQRELDKRETFDSDWDEQYLENAFTARFANLKYNDASLSRSELLNEFDPDMLDFSRDYILAVLPSPLIKAMNFDVDKEFIYGISIGDYLYVLTGGAGAFSSFRTGHFAGISMATFGWWYLFILGIGIIPAFYLFDVFARRKKMPAAGSEPAYTTLQFSFCGMIIISSIFSFLPNESVIMLITFLIRGWIQLALLYLVIFYITRMVTANYFKRLKFGH